MAALHITAINQMTSVARLGSKMCTDIRPCRGLVGRDGRAWTLENTKGFLTMTHEWFTIDANQTKPAAWVASGSNMMGVILPRGTVAIMCVITEDANALASAHFGIHASTKLYDLSDTDTDSTDGLHACLQLFPHRITAGTAAAPTGWSVVGWNDPSSASTNADASSMIGMPTTASSEDNPTPFMIGENIVTDVASVNLNRVQGRVPMIVSNRDDKPTIFPLIPHLGLEDAARGSDSELQQLYLYIQYRS